ALDARGSAGSALAGLAGPGHYARSLRRNCLSRLHLFGFAPAGAGLGHSTFGFSIWRGPLVDLLAAAHLRLGVGAGFGALADSFDLLLDAGSCTQQRTDGHAGARAGFA